MKRQLLLIVPLVSLASCAQEPQAEPSIDDPLVGALVDESPQGQRIVELENRVNALEQIIVTEAGTASTSDADNEARIREMEKRVEYEDADKPIP